MQKIRDVIRKIKDNDYNKILVVNIFGTILIRGGSIIISLFLFPLYIKYFNNESVLGLWFTMLSVLNWVVVFDLGLGNGLRNKLTESFSRGDVLKGKSYISSSYAIIGALALVMMLIGYLFSPYVDWNSLFNIDKNIISPIILLKSIRIIFFGTILQFLLKLINSILYSMQKSAVNNFLSLFTNLIILVYMFFSSGTSIELKLIYISYVNVLAVNLPLIVATIIIFETKLKKYKPSLSNVSAKYAKNIANIGLLFFMLQFASLNIGGTNEFLITTFLRPSDVVEYNIYNKIFATINSLFNIALIPMWSAVTKALYEGKISWIKSIHTLLFRVSLAVGVGLLAIIPFLQIIVDLWLNDESIIINWRYSLLFVILITLQIWNGCNSTIANGMGLLKAQKIALVFGAIINIPLAYLFSNITESWVSVIIANIISIIPICIYQPIYLRKEMEKAERQ